MVKGFHVVSMVTERKNNINMKLCKLTFPFHCDALQVLKYLRFFIWTFPWESYERFSPSAFLLSLLPSIPKILFLSTFFAYFWSFQPLLFSSASYFSYFTLISLISNLPTAMFRVSRGLSPSCIIPISCTVINHFKRNLMGRSETPVHTFLSKWTMRKSWIKLSKIVPT